MGVTPDANLQSFLENIFACPADVALHIAQCASDRRFPARGIILRQGESARAAFLIVAGRAHALLYAADGQVVLLHEYLAGDFFGAVAGDGAEPENADIRAIEAVHALTFLALDFLALIEAHGCVALTVSRMLLKQLRTTAVRMAERTTLSAAGRVHAELLRLARLGDGCTVRPTPVLTSLAIRVQSTRETVSRTISALERRGIIRREDDALVIAAPHRLEEMIV